MYKKFPLCHRCCCCCCCSDNKLWNSPRITFQTHEHIFINHFNWFFSLLFYIYHNFRENTEKWNKKNFAIIADSYQIMNTNGKILSKKFKYQTNERADRETRYAQSFASKIVDGEKSYVMNWSNGQIKNSKPKAKLPSTSSQLSTSKKFKKIRNANTHADKWKIHLPITEYTRVKYTKKQNKKKPTEQEVNRPRVYRSHETQRQFREA